MMEGTEVFGGSSSRWNGPRPQVVAGRKGGALWGLGPTRGGEGGKGRSGSRLDMVTGKGRVGLGLIWWQGGEAGPGLTWRGEGRSAPRLGPDMAWGRGGVGPGLTLWWGRGAGPGPTLHQGGGEEWAWMGGVVMSVDEGGGRHGTIYIYRHRQIYLSINLFIYIDFFCLAK